MDTASNESKRSDEPAPVELLSRPQGGGPGQRIREAREQAGLSVAELATQLRLTVPTLEALESDDFQTLKEPVYVRGYYRKCAKLLPLNEKELIATYDRVALPKTAVAAMPSKLLLASSEVEGRDPRVLLRWLLVVVFVIAVLAVVGLLFSRHERASVAPTAEAPAVASPEPGSAPGPTEATPSKPARASPAPAAPAAQSNTQQASGVPSPAPAVPASPAPQSLAPAHPEPTAPAAAAPSDAAGNGASSGPAAKPAPVAAATDPQAETGSNALVLDFSDQSWVEVFDASGKRLLGGMVQAGAHETLVGRLPYSVFLGNAPKVAVSFGGHPVDLTGRVRDNATARFQIPLN